MRVDRLDQEKDVFFLGEVRGPAEVGDKGRIRDRALLDRDLARQAMNRTPANGDDIVERRPDLILASPILGSSPRTSPPFKGRYEKIDACAVTDIRIH